MSTIANASLSGTSRVASTESSAVNPAVIFAGRLLFSLIFIMTAAGHFSGKMIGYAAAAGVPLASIAVPASGVIATLGGLSILLGYRVRIGAWLLVLFLIPVTVTMHNFWAVKDPMMAQIQMVMFMKNLALIGGAFLISQFGAGPWSLDSRREQRIR